MFKFFRKKLKILLYTDSRGDNIPGHTDYEHYGDLLAKKYNVEKYLCPEKWTTTLDFLDLIKKRDTKNYDLVILHTGIVDHSPRHQQVAINNIYKDKREIFDEVFGKKIIQDYLNSDFGPEYEGDKTVNLYSLEMAKEFLLPKLNEIPNLLWISSNRIIPGWNGNYWKPRPENISIIEEYSNLFLTELDSNNVIDLMTWSNKDIKKFTFDNMHPTKAGSDYIYEEILRKVKNKFG